MVEQVVMSLDEHDRLIAYVLGLSHALNIAFFTALAESGEAAPRLAKLSSTTFDSQLDVASRVAQESPELYFEIQSLNDYGSESLEALSQAVERLRTAVISQDFEAFATLMRRGREYLEDRRVGRRAPCVRRERARSVRGHRKSSCANACARSPRRCSATSCCCARRRRARSSCCARTRWASCSTASSPACATPMALDLVTLSLFDPQHELRHLSGNENLPSAVIEEVRFIDAVSPLAPKLAQFDRPWLGAYNAARPRSAGVADAEHAAASR